MQRLTAAERSGNFFDVALRNPGQPDDGSGRGSCVFLRTERFFFFGLFGVAALTPAGTLAALGRLCGTPWRGSAGTASRTS